MELIVDSGATKTTWHYLAEDTMIDYSWTTRGYNPAVVSHKAIEDSIKSEALHKIPQDILRKVQKIYFYGAGCTKYEAKDEMTQILERCFPNMQIIVESDLLAAARAACGNKKGICCILSTGSNSCIYDGNDIAVELPALGYMLSDEGGEISLGKLLLRNYLYELMPEHLCAEFGQMIAVTVKNITLENADELSYNKQLSQKVIRMLYQGGDYPNTYLAQFAKFVDGKSDDPYIADLVRKAFCEFIELRILPYFGQRFGCEKSQYKIHALGTVVFSLKHIWEEALNSYHLEIGDIIQTPFPKLSAFHFSKLKHSI